jgi:hypothetical protein
MQHLCIGNDDCSLPWTSVLMMIFGIVHIEQPGFGHVLYRRW